MAKLSLSGRKRRFCLIQFRILVTFRVKLGSNFVLTRSNINSSFLCFPFRTTSCDMNRDKIFRLGKSSARFRISWGFLSSQILAEETNDKMWDFCQTDFFGERIPWFFELTWSGRDALGKFSGSWRSLSPDSLAEDIVPGKLSLLAH